jgi:predicted ATPase/DNA-binding winged helix-turn-helix (wHTH) protein
LEISVLGPVEVRRDGRPVAVPGGKTSELLVRLALEAGDSVSSDRLVDDLWDEAAVNTQRNTLQSKVSRLRRAFDDPAVIESTDGGYRLAVEPAEVDALVVMRDVVDASQLLASGNHREASQLSATALALFRGDVMPGAGDAVWATTHKARLHEARLKLIETELSARLQLGDIGDVIGELEAAVATYPFQEGLWELLIKALYLAGRQADALAAYQRVRARLSDDLGLDPGPELRALEQQILNHDVALKSASRARAGNLPSMASQLVGRDTEIEALSAMLRESRLVEIVGPGGVGKTAAAIATGRSLAESEDAPTGGVWLARLEAATTADEVLDTLLAAMTVAGGEAALVERLKRQPTVVILDNCEHVADAAADLTIRLLDAAPELAILCTSQVRLQVDGEAILDLAPLALDDAVALFTSRATRRRSQTYSDRLDDSVHDLCRSLDGLPLAIELAAARTKTLSIEEITRRLDDRFPVLNDPTSRLPERRRALRATIGWSYELLFPDDKRGLWALATFADGAVLPAIEWVLEALHVPSGAGIDVIGRLAGRSLVIVDDRDPSANRYRLLDSIRAFALEALREEDLLECGFAANVAWLADAARGSTAGVRSAHQATHLAFVKTERANIDAALGWAGQHDPLVALRMANGFGWAWIVLGDSRGAQRILTALGAAGGLATDSDRAEALLLASWLEASTDQLALAHEHIMAATEISERLDDADLEARCAYYLAYVVSHQGDWTRALELTDRSHALYEGLDRPWDQSANWLFAARAAISAGDLDRAVQAREQVERWLQNVDDPWLHVRREAMLGELARVDRRFDDAVAHTAAAAESSGRLGFQQTEAYQLSSLGRAQCQAGDYEVGAATLELATAKAQATGDMRLAALVRVHLARVRRALGDRPGARAAAEKAAAWHREAAGGEQAALGECLLAALDAEDEVPDAAQRLAEILTNAQLRADAPVEVLALDALARIAAESDDQPRARSLRDRADERMLAASHFITELDRVDRPMPAQLG